ncbi:UNVERIFIED_CONTAM: nucleoside-diphosphate-sugar epimerase [Acetivibrio alkalicellulosi]
MKHIVVTGSNGMVGSQVVEALLKKNNKVTGISMEPISKVKHENYNYISMDLTDYSRLKDIFKQYNFSNVIHLAAIAHSRKGIKLSWSRYYRINTLVSRQIFEIATEKNIPIFFSSTIDVYGIQDDMITENTKPTPIGFYAKSKVLAEQALIEIAKQPFLIARFAPIYSKENQIDIQKRYFIKYPKLGYIIGSGLEYEFLSLSKVVQLILNWCDNESKYTGIINVSDENKINTRLKLNEECKNGNCKFIMYIPRWIAILINRLASFFIGKQKNITFMINKIINPIKIDKKTQIVIGGE